MKTKLFPGLLAILAGACSPLAESPSPDLAITFPAAYVVNGESSTLSVLSLTTNEVAGLVQLTNSPDGHGGHGGAWLRYPHHAALHPDGTLLALGIPGIDLSAGHGGEPHNGESKASVTLIDARTGTIKKVLSLPAPNHNAIFSPDGGEIWTSQMQANGQVLVYDAMTYDLKNTIPVGKEPAEVTFSTDGSTAFVANGADQTVTAIDPQTKQVRATVPVGANPVGAWPGADGRMYVDNEDGRSISVLDVKTLRVLETIPLGFMPGFAAYEPTTGELWVTDPEGGTVHWWTKTAGGYQRAGRFLTGAGAHAIAFRGSTAYVTNQDAGTVSVVDRTKHQSIKEIRVGLKPNGIVLVP